MTHDQLLNYIKGETTEADRIDILRWIEADPQNRTDYESLRRIYDALLCSDDTEVAASPHPRVNVWRRIAASAAVAAIALTAGYFSAGILDSTDDSTYAATPRSIRVPVGQRAEITLEDGTHVWLNSNSTLDINPDTGNGTRQVALNGEAYFDVARDEQHPFIVTTGQHEIQVLGTSFDVCAYGSGNDFSLKLLSGKVLVTDTESGQSATMTKGNMITNGLAVTPMSQTDSTVWWIKGIYHFDDCEYGEIFRQLEERYHVTVNVTNPEVLKFRCTSKFSMEDGLIHIVRGIQRVHDFQYEYDEPNRTLTIS